MPRAITCASTKYFAPHSQLVESWNLEHLGSVIPKHPVIVTPHVRYIRTRHHIGGYIILKQAGFSHYEQAKETRRVKYMGTQSTAENESRSPRSANPFKSIMVYIILLYSTAGRPWTGVSRIPRKLNSTSSHSSDVCCRGDTSVQELGQSKRLWLELHNNLP